MSVGTLEELSGTVEKITFYNETNGFCVLKINKFNNKSNNLITIVGSSCNVNVGEHISCHGNWVKDRTHGLQFKAQKITLNTPNTIVGIEKYLGSGLIKGIGPSFAKRLVTAFGCDIFNIIESEPHKLLELSGIGLKRYQKILETWASQKEVRKIIMFLHEHGIGTARAVKIYKVYKEQAIDKIKANPYRLALDIHGIGFKTADLLARSLGIPKDSIIRAEAGVRFILQQFVADGNCAMFKQELIQTVMQQLDLSEDLIQTAIDNEILAKRIVIEDHNNGTNVMQQLVFLTSIYLAECYVAKQISTLNHGNPAWYNLIDVDHEINQIERVSKIKFSNSQLLAIKTAIQHKVIIITGGPGVGKTTVARSILHIICGKTNKVLLCAPTGKAAKRLSGATNMPAVTLHRLLSIDPKNNKFKYNEDHLLDAKLILVDEVSMIDLLMFANLLKAIPKDSSLILMGDVDQLPSVGAGSVLADLILSDAVRVVKLQEIFRQAAHSQIIVNAHRINEGKLPILTPPIINNQPTTSDFYFIKVKNIENLPNKLVEVINRIESKFSFKLQQDIQVLSPMNKGITGVMAINSLLQKKFNVNANDPKLIVTKFGSDFVVGDKVIQTINNYDKEVFNGDLGIIQAIDHEDGSLLINFDNREISYDFNELDEITLAYAITIHKAQGSEYPVVIIPICLQHYTLLQKNLIYTGVTRGKSLVILIGEVQALAIAVKNNNCKIRITTLMERLINKKSSTFY